MLCKEIMNTSVHWIPDGTSVSQAAKLMAMHRVELLPICAVSGHPRGVITDRDIVVRVVAKGRVAELTRVDEVITNPTEFVPPDCPVERAAEVMSREGVSQLLVLDDDGRLAGIIGLNELLIHAPAGCTSEIMRGIIASRPGDPPSAVEVASAPFPTVTSGESPANDTPVENPARVEAEIVVRGGVNDLKEFPG